MLNRYDKTYSTILFWLENPALVLRLVNIEDGILHKQVLPDTVDKNGVVIISGGTYYKVISSTKNNSILYLLKMYMGIEDIEYFIKYFNRYVRPWANNFSKEKLKIDGTPVFKMRDETEYDPIFNFFPIPIDTFITISKLSTEFYNIDNMINDLLNNIVLPIEKYKLNSSISYTILNDIIFENSEKIKEYFNGKIGVLNMLLGEYLKKSNDKTVNKMYLKNIILEQMKLSNEIIL